MGYRIGVYRILVENPEGERNNLKDPGVDGSIILRWIFRSGMLGHGLDRCGSGGQVTGTCESDNEASGFIKCGEFLE
jgi:hypothetical protein